MACEHWQRARAHRRKVARPPGEVVGEGKLSLAEVFTPLAPEWHYCWCEGMGATKTCDVLKQCLWKYFPKIFTLLLSQKADWKIVWELFKINPFVPFLQMQVIAERFGICLSQILPIKKYISGLDLTCSVDILLSLVRQMICLADSYFDNFPSEELKENAENFL